MSLENAPASGELLGMSDDDFLKMNGPPEGGETQEVEEEADPDPAAAEQPVVKDEPKEQEPGAEDDEQPEAAESDEDPAKTPAEADKPEANADGKPAKGETNPEQKPEAAAPGSEATSIQAPSAEDAQSFFMKVMAPFKANGKMIQLKSPEEVIQLMQMGANYTRKLQDIQPHRKVLLMLQNNGLLDEGKLSYLIDLDKKNPEAIKKLVKDAGIDPMDIDTSAEPAYFEGNHRVTDEEASFHQALNDLTSTQAGKETVQLIHTNWDQASKELLWKSPEVMSIIHQQRETGVYDLITAEMDRQITLGQIPPNTPFLQAYKTVGDAMAQANGFTGLGAEQPGAQPGNPAGKPEPAVVATRAAAPKSTLANGEKASAASPTRTTPRKVEKLVNPLAMSDDEFLNQFSGRV